MEGYSTIIFLDGDDDEFLHGNQEKLYDFLEYLSFSRSKS